MEDRIISGQESLELITKMIRNTQSRFERFAGTPFIIWGYSTILISVAVWYMLTRTGDPNWNLLWFGIIPLGIIGMLIFHKKNEKHVNTYIDKVVGYIWIVIGSVAILASLMAMFGPLRNILFIIALLINVGATLTGLTLKLRYVYVLGFVGILIAFALPFFQENVNQIWVFTALFATTMVIPGHIMNAQGRKLNRKNS